MGRRPKSRHRDKITYSLCSGANNITLAISLALLYFPPETSVFMVLSEIPWVLTLIPFRYALDRFWVRS